MSDLIERQVAIDAIEDEWNGCTGEYPASEIINDTCQRITDLPSAEPHSINLNQAQSSDMISRQKAIDALNGITTYKNSIPIDSAVFNIKKLPTAEQQIIACGEGELGTNMAEVGTDLISRQQAIDAVHDAYRMCPIFDVLGLHNVSIQLLEQLPSAEPQNTDWSEYSDKLWKLAYERGKADAEPQERKTGRWRRMPMACYGGGTITEYECSNCEEHQVTTSDFCPNCGARMEVTDDRF